MIAYTQAQQAIAEMRAHFTPELKRRIITFTVASLILGLLAVLLLALFGATYEPFTWTVLVLVGAAYGWFAHEQLVRDDLWDVIDRCEAYIATLEAQLDEAEDN